MKTIRNILLISGVAGLTLLANPIITFASPSDEHEEYRADELDNKDTFSIIGDFYHSQTKDADSEIGKALPATYTSWQDSKDHDALDCKVTDGDLDCRYDAKSCEAAYSAPFKGTAVDVFYKDQGRWSGKKDPKKQTQRGTRITPHGGTQQDLGFRCVTMSPGKVPGKATVVVRVTQRDFASLPVKALDATAGPPGGWLPVNMINVLHASPDVQTLETTLLGQQVTIRAIPVKYHWDLGDGNTITTTKPGKPYPSKQISSTYRYEGWYDVTLTTTFVGQYSLAGGPWQDIQGTIEKTSDPVEIYSKSMTSRLHNPENQDKDGGPVADSNEEWLPPRTLETEGPKDKKARHRTIR